MNTFVRTNRALECFKYVADPTNKRFLRRLKVNILKTEESLMLGSAQHFKHYGGRFVRTNAFLNLEAFSYRTMAYVLLNPTYNNY